MERATEGSEGGDFEALIDLSKIAEKAKEEKIRRDERLRNGENDGNKYHLKPFSIEGIVKEDLNIVMPKEAP
jgi:hypothetical protein